MCLIVPSLDVLYMLCHLCYQVRLMLTLAPIACVLAAIGLSSILTRFSGVIKEHKLFSNTVAAQKGDAFPFLSHSSLFFVHFNMTHFLFLPLSFSFLFPSPSSFLFLPLSYSFLFPSPSSYFVYLTITPLT